MIQHTVIIQCLNGTSHTVQQHERGKKTDLFFAEKFQTFPFTTISFFSSTLPT